MRINISLNEVLRDFISQFIYTYDKYISQTDINANDVTSFDLLDTFKFESLDRLNSFLYLEAPLEIFGHADQAYDGLMNKFNEFLMDMDDDGEHEISLVSREVNKAIPSTLFFLSKTGCRASNISFVKKNEDEWKDADVLITANPKSLAAKPDGKISVKVKTPYNTDASADYEVESILDFINDEELRVKILTKIITTTYEEIK
jgi:5'(3')-deoxyribonucleotidase